MIQENTIRNEGFKNRWWEEDGVGEYLYHFTSIDSLLKILISDSFRVSNIDYMNDMNESIPICKFFNSKIPKNTIDNMIKIEEDLRKKIFLACFSVLSSDDEIRNKTSMWGHYGCSGRGVCIKLNKKKLDEKLYNIIYNTEFDAIDTNYNIQKFKIKYKPQSKIDVKKLNFLKSGGTGLPLYAKFKYLYGEKSDEWIVENEFRYLIIDAMNNLNNHLNTHFYIKGFNNLIEHITIGYNQTENSINLIKNIQKKLCSNIPFFIIDGSEMKNINELP